MSELYELPDGWEWKTLEDVFLIERGGSPRPIKDYITDSKDGINWIKIADATRGDGKYIEFTQQKIKPEGLQKSRLVEEGDFIMSNSMSFGRPYIMKTKGAIHDGWLLMRSKYEDVDKEFFYHLLSSNYMYQQFKKKASGTTVKNLNIGLVKTTNIPLPPLQEQKRIVSKLDTLFAKIDQAITHHQQNIESADALMGSVLDEVFGELEGRYEKDYLSNFCQITSSKRVYKNDYVDEGIPFYRIKDIVLKAKGYELKDMQFISQTAYEVFNEKFGSPKEGDILITAVGATLGYVYLVSSQDGDFYFKDGNIVWLKNISDNLIRKYILYSFNSPLFQRYIEEISKGAAQPAITIVKLKELKIPIPPLKTQQKTVQYLDQLSEKTEKLKQEQQAKMKSLKELKASLLDRAFRGEL